MSRDSNKKKRGPDADRWTHDRFNVADQMPKSTRDIVRAYGYDIRKNNKQPDGATLPAVKDTKEQMPKNRNERQRNR
jgi:hypothetical protein